MKKIKGGRAAAPAPFERPPGGGSYVRQSDGSLVLADSSEREELAEVSEAAGEPSSADAVDSAEGAASPIQEV